eukprot:scaffold15944_cov248-Ochromonas_danica.AAC.10
MRYEEVCITEIINEEVSVLSPTLCVATPVKCLKSGELGLVRNMDFLSSSTDHQDQINQYKIDKIDQIRSHPTQSSLEIC